MEINTDKKTIFIIIAVLVITGVAIGAFFYFKNKSSTENALENAADAAQTLTNSATKGVLPSMGTNPLENKPDLNPADKTNPYKGIKTNPFE